MLYSNCSDYLYIISREVYEMREKDYRRFVDEVIMVSVFDRRRVKGYISIGYVNPYESLDMIVEHIRKGDAYIVEFDPLNWPFEIEPAEGGLREPPESEPSGIGFDDELEEILGFPPLYAEKPIIPGVVSRLRDSIKVAERSLPGSVDIYRAYLKLYSLALQKGLDGAGLVTTIAGIVTTRYKAAAVIGRVGGDVCVGKFTFRSLADLRRRVRMELVKALDMCSRS